MATDPSLVDYCLAHGLDYHRTRGQVLRGELPGYKSGGRYYVKSAEVQDRTEQRQSAGASAGSA